MIFTASLFDVQHKNGGSEDKPVSLLISSGKVLDRIVTTFEWLDWLYNKSVRCLLVEVSWHINEQVPRSRAVCSNVDQTSRINESCIKQTTN